MPHPGWPLLIVGQLIGIALAFFPVPSAVIGVATKKVQCGRRLDNKVKVPAPIPVSRSGFFSVILLFLHGWQSTPGGLKPTYLKDHGHTVLNPALPDDDFDAAVRIAQAEFDQGRPDVVVGSSRGGAVAVNINSGNTPLVLLCPAWKRWGTATTVKPNTTILHAPADETVPFADSQELLRNSGLPESALIVVGRDHRLADPEPLKAMLEAVEKAGGRG